MIRFCLATTRAVQRFGIAIRIDPFEVREKNRIVKNTNKNNVEWIDSHLVQYYKPSQSVI